MMRFALAPFTGASLLVTLVAASPGPAHADLATSLDFSTRLDGTSSSTPSLIRLAPAAEIRVPGLRVFADGRSAAMSDHLRLQAARASMGCRVAQARGVGAELRLDGIRTDPARATPRHDLRGQGRVVLDGRRVGAWIGGGVQLASERDGVSPALIGFGGWTSLGAFSISGGLEQTEEVRTTIFPARVVFPQVDDTIGVNQPEQHQRETLTSTHAHARFDWGRGPIEVETVAGLSFGRRLEPRHWAQARISVALVRQLALVATAGSRAPQWYALDAAGERQATLGVRLVPSLGPSRTMQVPTLAPIASAWRLQPASGGRYTIRMRAPGARSVEIMGDMTGWEAIALDRLGGDQWGTELEMTPGLHRLNLRLDGGAWIAPPGVATVVDDFSGEVGVIVVE